MSGGSLSHPVKCTVQTSSITYPASGKMQITMPTKIATFGRKDQEYVPLCESVDGGSKLIVKIGKMAVELTFQTQLYGKKVANMKLLSVNGGWDRSPKSG